MGEELCCNTGGSDNAGAKEGTLAGGAGPRPESPDRPDTGRGNTVTGSDLAIDAQHRRSPESSGGRS